MNDTNAARWPSLLAACLLVCQVAACGESVAADDDEQPVPDTVCGDGAIEGDESCDEGELNGAVGHCLADCSRMPNTVAVSGDVMAFLTEVPGPRIVGATVTVLEHPEMKVVTGDDAHFRFEGLTEGERITLLVEHEDFKPTQTAAVTVGELGIHPFSVQVLSKGLFTALSALVPLPIEEDSHCVIASTAGRFGTSLYVRLRQGMPDVQVALEPAPPEGSGPIYFDEDVLPAPEQPATSIDGGVFFYRMPPGDYVMSASREGYAFSTVRFQCRAGIVVNAGPPLGLLAHVREPDHSAGMTQPDGASTASSDAMCEATARCVNEAAGVVDYPDATLASCKAMFRNVWASVDESCDATGAMTAAARAVYDCRAASCEVALGFDEACAEEEVAFRAAEAVYGACVAASP